MNGKITFWVMIIAAWTGLAGADGTITDITLTGGQAEITFASKPGSTYQLQRTDSLTSASWQDAGAPVTATAASTTINVATSSNSDYYRVLEDVFWYHWEYYSQNPVLSDWGMGSNEISYVHKDRSYDWYVDQGDTGASSGNNCGPATTVMAIKWYNSSYTGTVEQARAWAPNGGGWWWTDDILGYLELNSIPHTTNDYINTTQLEEHLAADSIVLLCITTSNLTYNATSTERTGRFYRYDSGHFLLVKGVRKVDGKTYFEVYDSNTLGKLYGDGTPKGRNRHLLAADLHAAITAWWPYIIVINPPAGGTSAPAAMRSESDIIADPSEIVHMWGK